MRRGAAVNIGYVYDGRDLGMIEGARSVFIANVVGSHLLISSTSSQNAGYEAPKLPKGEYMWLSLIPLSPFFYRLLLSPQTHRRSPSRHQFYAGLYSKITHVTLVTQKESRAAQW
jgi:hypothetical protein